MKTLQELLKELNACNDALKFVKDKTIEQALEQSHRGDWILWLAKKLDLPLNKLTLAKARCAKTVIHLMKDQRSIDAVNVAERFGLDECTLEELNAYAASAYAVSADYAAFASAYAAAAAYSDAAYSDASDSAASDSDASDSDASAAADYARIKNQQQTSDICIEILGQLIIDSVNSKLI